MNYLAGKTNSPIPIPEYYPENIVGGKGAYVINKDGKEYIDLWMGYGALLFGHADADIISVAKESMENGWFFSYQTEIEKKFSEIIHGIIPCAECVRYATTGSDAVAYALRVARAYTGRKDVLSVTGGYHGVHEGMVSDIGVNTNVLPCKVPFNDISKAREELNKKKYACMILEPVLANSGCTLPDEDYLSELRRSCDETGTVLIFDEIVTGFRLGIGGAQKRFGVTPDISLFSKAVTGGFPLSIICGKEAIMENFIPNGTVFFAGTFNGHSLSLAVAKTIIVKLDDDFYQKNRKLGERLSRWIVDCLCDLEINGCVQNIDSMLTLAFGCKSFRKGLSEEEFDGGAYDRFIREMASRGILFPPLPTETIFLSPVHEEVIDLLEKEIKAGLTSLKEQGYV